MPTVHCWVRSVGAMAHPRCVGWGEIGLDYHYDNSPREIQQEVFVRQLRQAIRLGKPLTIHTREADEDIERILKAEVPKSHKVRLFPKHILTLS
jgi:TatD DNase family protein